MSLILGIAWTMLAVVNDISRDIFLLGIAIIVHAMVVEMMGTKK